MQQMYIIYVNDSIIRIHEIEKIAGTEVTELDEKKEMERLISHVNEMLSNPRVQNLDVKCVDSKKFLKKVKQKLLYIKAAGGLVKNDQKEYLFIFRRGKWDLPKGKLDTDEKVQEAAVREVEEECGIKVYMVKNELESTYHIYQQAGKLVFKRTSWFLMKSVDNQKLIPQLEEDITEARWFKTEDLDEVRANTFPSVLDVMKNIPVKQKISE